MKDNQTFEKSQYGKFVVIRTKLLARMNKQTEDCDITENKTLTIENIKKKQIAWQDLNFLEDTKNMDEPKSSNTHYFLHLFLFRLSYSHMT